MAIDLTTLSAKELENLISKAKARKTALKKRKPLSAVRAKLKAAAAAEGYSIAELFGTGTAAAGAAESTGRGRQAAGRGTRAARKSTGKVAPKYRNPEKPEETWTGRGKQPRWLAQKVSDGAKVEDFLIAA
jgi:DNA-binding protein H-NS